MEEQREGGRRQRGELNGGLTLPHVAGPAGLHLVALYKACVRWESGAEEREALRSPCRHS